MKGTSHDNIESWRYRDMSFEERFSRWDVDEDSGCWVWRGCTNPDGYGLITFEGRQTTVHRVSYILHVGDIPPGKELDHICKNRRCLNPAHLEAVVHRENVMRGGSAIRSEFCKKGHRFDGYDKKRNRQYCKTCKNEVARRLYARRQQ
jgi:hypothetical protein